jgi:PilZ domain
VLDLSTVGAQVISPTILRPNQKVRITIPTGDFQMRFRGAIAWAKFEMSKAVKAPQYRAGVAFTDSDAAAIDTFCARNRS